MSPLLGVIEVVLSRSGIVTILLAEANAKGLEARKLPPRSCIDPHIFVSIQDSSLTTAYYLPIACLVHAKSCIHLLGGHFVCTPRVREDSIWWDLVVEEVMELESLGVEKSHRARLEWGWALLDPKVMNFGQARMVWLLDPNEDDWTSGRYTASQRIPIFEIWFAKEGTEGILRRQIFRQLNAVFTTWPRAHGASYNQ